MIPEVLLRLPDRKARPDYYDCFVSLPYAPDNRVWIEHTNLSAGTRRRGSKWIAPRKAWAVHRSSFHAVIEGCLDRYGDAYVLQEYRTDSTRKCDTRCVNAKGDECVCSCAGVNHKGSMSGYILVGETVLLDIVDGISTTKRLVRRK